MTSDPDVSTGGRGPATDAANAPVFDPSANVLDLVAAAIRRQDDLRNAEAQHVREVAELRAKYSEDMRLAEAARLDAIRSVDVTAVQQAATVAETRATALAAQVAAAAEAMRSQVSATQTAAATSLAAALVPIQEAIADLRRAQYEAQGQKTQVVDRREATADSRGGLLVAIAITAVVVSVIIGASGALITLLLR